MPNSGYAHVLKNRGFTCLLVAQALSVFDDNAFRYVLQLLAIDTVATLSGQSRLVSGHERHHHQDYQATEADFRPRC